VELDIDCCVFCLFFVCIEGIEAMKAIEAIEAIEASNIQSSPVGLGCHGNTRPNAERRQHLFNCSNVQTFKRS
jgi:hypothetical protein